MMLFIITDMLNSVYGEKSWFFDLLKTSKILKQHFKKSFLIYE